MAVVNAVLAALFHRERSGRGQYVEVPMYETMVAFMLAEHLGGLTFDPAPTGAGYARLLSGGRKPARTLDGYIGILPYTADHWAAFFRSAGRDDLAERYGIADKQARNKYITEMYRDMADIIAGRTTADWVRICNELDIPVTPIIALDDLPHNPQLEASGLFRNAVHPSEGNIRYVAPATKFSDSPAGVRMQAPALGGNSAEILAEAGYTATEIADLAERRIVRQASA